MLWVDAASTDRDYTTTGRLKARVLGTTATSTVEDEQFSLAIRVASRWADSYVGYPVGLASYLETLAGYGRRHVMLGRTPVRAVRRLYDSTDTGTATQMLSTEFRVEDRDAGFLSRDDGWAWTVPAEMELALRPKPGEEYRPWLVDYVAGYVYGGLSTDSPNWSTEHGSTDTGRTLPEEIEEAVVAKAQAVYEGQDEPVVSEQLGDLSVSYGGGRSGVSASRPALYEALLDNYRRLK